MTNESGSSKSEIAVMNTGEPHTLLKRMLYPLVLLLLLTPIGFSQRPQGGPPPVQTGQPAPAATSTTPPTPPVPEEPPVTTRHEIKIGERTLKYATTTGLMPIKNVRTGETEARLFYMAYTLDGADPKTRPLMFSFNGG